MMACIVGVRRVRGLGGREEGKKGRREGAGGFPFCPSPFCFCTQVTEWSAYNPGRAEKYTSTLNKECSLLYQDYAMYKVYACLRV